MPKKRQLNTIRTDCLEIRIAFYLRRRNYDAAEALRWLARDIAAPIDESIIKQKAIEYYKMDNLEPPKSLEVR